MDYKGIDFGVYMPASILPFWIQISSRAKVQQKSSPCRAAARALGVHCKVWASKDTAHSSCSFFPHLWLLSLLPSPDRSPSLFFHHRSRTSSHWQFTQGLKVLFHTPELEDGLQSGLTNPSALSHSLCPPQVTKAIKAPPFFFLLFGHLTMPKITSCSTVNLRRSWPWCWEISGRKQN